VEGGGSEELGGVVGVPVVKLRKFQKKFMIIAGCIVCFFACFFGF
jgi:hypothetical protein